MKVAFVVAVIIIAIITVLLIIKGTYKFDIFFHLGATDND